MSERIKSQITISLPFIGEIPIWTETEEVNIVKSEEAEKEASAN